MLQRYYESVLESSALDRSACMQLDAPVKYAQLAGLLRRASLLSMEKDAQTVRLSGPTGNSPAFSFQPQRASACRRSVVSSVTA